LWSRRAIGVVILPTSLYQRAASLSVGKPQPEVK
jgi:hypothetical protein